MTRAVIDVGSNSVLTLVSRWSGQAWQTIVETTAVTGLGKGTKSTGLLSEEGMSKTLAAVREGFETARINGAEKIVAAATMAARIASNSSEFIDRAKQQGTPISVLTGDDEARLGFEAVANDPLFRSQTRISVIDVGGHSTELVTADKARDGWNVTFQKSFAVGALGLREGALRLDSPGFKERLQAVSDIDNVIGLKYLPGQAGHPVTLGATGTNLVTIREALSTWDPMLVHGAWLDYEEVSKAVAWMCTLDDAGRAAIIGIEKGREHTLHAGALILERFLFALGVNGCSVSVRGWRHALLDSLDH